ncbi:MAG TPA: hypothetical protein VFI05_07200 [Nitrospiraceae bacterium]|nr:hypothetical protein [Nitrospiraceae bacterium]
MMKVALPFASLILIGLLGSLHSPPTDSHSSIAPEEDTYIHHGRTIVDGTIKFLHPETQTITIKTDRGRIFIFRLSDLQGFDHLRTGTHVHLEIDWNEDDDWPNRFSPPESHPHIRRDATGE